MTIQRLIPPALLDMLRRIRKPPFGFFGDEPSFEAAAAAAGSGYSDPALVEGLVAAELRALARPAGRLAERDLQLGAVLARIGATGSLSVLDFGGGVGGEDRRARVLAPALELRWDVVETEALAAAAAAAVSRPGLEFHGSLDAVAGRSYDLVHASGSLQYVPDAEEVWRHLAATGHRWLCLNRIPFVPGDRDRYAVQRVPGGAAYPARFLAEDAWRTRIAATHDVVFEWDVPGDAPYADRIEGVRYAGLLLERR